MHDTAVKVLSRVHSAVYRISRGRIGRRLVNNDMLLLTSTGRISGQPHTVPLLHLEDGDDQIVIASYGGRPHDPEWYRNLVAHPTATVTVGRSRYEVAASTMPPDERDVWWPRIVDAYTDYALYQSRTQRTIPVVRLTPVVR